MSNTNRVRWGEQGIIPFAVESATVIEIGDFVGISNNYLINIASLADAGDAAANREAGADIFVGIALSASASGETDDVLVQTAGVVMLNQKTAAAIHQGDPVEIYASADGCEDQTIVEGSTSAIAVCVKTHTDSTTETLCKLLPSKILGTAQA